MCLWTSWCFKILVFKAQDKLLKVGVKLCKYDLCLFYNLKDGKLRGIIVCFVDDISWGGTDKFKTQVIEP